MKTGSFLGPLLFNIYMNDLIFFYRRYLIAHADDTTAYASDTSPAVLDRGYYMVARRYEFYVRVARTISHEWAQRTNKILFLTREHKIHILRANV